MHATWEGCWRTRAITPALSSSSCKDVLDSVTSKQCLKPWGAPYATCAQRQLCDMWVPAARTQACTRSPSRAAWPLGVLSTLQVPPAVQGMHALHAVPHLHHHAGSLVS